MPDLAIHVSGLVVGVPAQISFKTYDSDGLESAGEVDVDFNDTISQEIDAIITKAKLEHSAAHSTVFSGTEKIHVYGGRVR